MALIGLSITLVDSWLDRRLPHAGDGRAGAAWLYVVVALIGTMVVLPLVVVGLFASGDPADARKGLALVAVGLVTLRWWFLSVKGEAGPPARLTIAGRAALLVAVILGAMETVPEVSRALGMT